MNSEKISRVANMGHIVIAGLFISCLFSWTVMAQNTQTSKDKADQNLKSSARVNPSTLAMEFSLPLGNYPGRGGNSMPFSISYSSKVWNMQMSNIRYEFVDVPDTQTYHHIAYSSTEVAAVFAEKTVAGWTSSLKPFQITGVPEMYYSSGSLFQPGVTGGGNNIWEAGCYFTYMGLRASTSCASYEAVTHVICYNESGEIMLEDDRIECVDFGPSGGGGNGGGNPTGSPTEQNINMVYRYRIEMPDGSTKEFRKDDRVRDCTADPLNCDGGLDGTYLSVDGSGMRLEHNELQSDNSTKDVLYLPNGSKYIFPVIVPTPTYGKLIDKNGNVSLYDPGNKVWTDTMGREFTDPFPIPSPLSRPDTYPITLKGINNADVTYQVEWLKLDTALEDPANTRLEYVGPDACDRLEAHSVGDSLFQNQATSPFDDQTRNQVRYISQTRVCASGWGLPPNYGIFNPLVMASIALPDGSKYEFKYNKFGEITKIIYPTGGYERFEYGYVPPMGMTALEIYTQGNRGVLSRYVSIDGLTETQEWAYSMFYDEGANYGIRTIAPDGSKTERILHTSTISSFGFEDPRNGMAKEERSFDTNGVLRLRTLTDWIVLGPQGQNAYGNASRDPRVKRSVSIIFDPNSSSALATMSETDYDEGGSTDPTYFSHLNAIRKKGYHYAVLNKADVDTEQLAWTTISGWFTGKLAAVSETDYSYSPYYRARGIIGLPTETKALNPTNPGDVLTKSQPVYDEGGAYFIDVGTTTAYQSPTGANAHLRGNVTTSRTWVKESNTWLQTHTAYDNFGNARKAWDAGGDPDKFVETDFSSEYKYAYPTKVIAPAPDTSNSHGTNQTSTAETTYDFTTGLMLSVKDDFGQVTTTEYDSIMRPIRVNPVVVGGVATGPVSETTFGVPVNGHLPGSQRFVKVKKQIDANNWDEATTYMDSFGRVIKTVAKDSEGDVTVETHYDLLGRVDRVTNPYRAGDTVYWNKTRYDELGRAVESYAPAPLADLANAQSLGVTSFGISTGPSYVGTVVTTTDASGRKGRSITNALGQLVRVDEPATINGPNDLGDVGSPNQPTYYKYDAYGNMVQVTQGVQNRYFKYNSLGRLIRVNQPEQEYHEGLDLPDAYNTSGHWTAAFDYDDLGNLVTTIDAKGVTTVNSYDRAGRVTTRAYYGEPEPGPKTPAVYFFYDGKGLDAPQTPNYAKGKLTKVSSSVSETRYKLFDNFGRLREMDQRIPATDIETVATATPRVSKYTYNLSGALVEEEYPSGRKVKNELESDGDIKRIYGKATATASEQTYVNSFAYTPDGKIEKLRLGNGLWESAKFNERLQVTQLALGHSVNEGSLWKLNYEYGELNADGSVNTTKNTGNIAKQLVNFTGLSHPFVQIYKYDSLQRLTEARETKNNSQTWKQTFGYDRYGNRNSFTQVVGNQNLPINSLTLPVVDINTNRFQTNPSQGYAYDKNGNIRADPASGGRQFVFNGDNKQVEVRDANGNPIGKYFYDGEGRRVKKVTDFETTIFVYSAGKLAAEYSTQTPPANPTINYTATDQVGSPRVLTDKYGTVVSRRDFMPFGEEIYADGQNRTIAGKYSTTGEDAVRKRFTGYEKDKETGLDFAEARYYNNRHARFTAVDPLLASGQSADPQTFNRYVYVLNGPLVKTDPTGLQTGTVPVINGGVLARQDSERCYECPTLEWQNSSTNFGPFGSVRYGQFSPVIYDTQIDWSPQSQGFADWIELRNNPGRSPEGLSFLEYAGRGSGKGFVNFFPNSANSAIKAGGIPSIGFMIPDIPTFEYTNWTESIAGHATEFITGGAIFGMTGGASATKTIRTPTQLSWIRGVEGEAAVGISGSKETIPSLTGTAKFRVPDRLTPTTLDEVKNVQRLSYTRQVKDFHLFSQATNRQFSIFVRPTTTFSGPLRKLIEEGTIFTQNIP